MIRPARIRTYQVEVFEVSSTRRPFLLTRLSVEAGSLPVARARAKDAIAKAFPSRRVRSFSSNNRNGGFIAYLTGVETR